MPESPLISIVTPAYNAMAFIEATYKSILAQDFTNWEWLAVVDKKSSDETLQWLRHCADKDPRVHCIVSDASGGTANNRRLALAAAKGKYVAFLDADDLWTPGKLSRQVRYMEEGNILFSYTGYQWMDASGVALERIISAPPKITYGELLSHRYSIGCLTVMIDRNFFKDVSYEDVGAEDFTFWLKLLRKIPYASGLSENLGFYRIVQGSRSRNKFRWALHRWVTLRVSERLSLLSAAYYFSLYAFRALFSRI